VTTARDLLHASSDVAAHAGDAIARVFVRRVRALRLLSLLGFGAVVAAPSSLWAALPEDALAPLALALVVEVVLALLLGRARVAVWLLHVSLPVTAALVFVTLEHALGALPVVDEAVTGAARVCAATLLVADLVALATERALFSLGAAVAIGALAPVASFVVPSVDGAFTPLGAALGAVVAITLVVSARASEHSVAARFGQGEVASAVLHGLVALPASIAQALKEGDSLDEKLA